MQKTSALPVPLQKSDYQGRELVHTEKSKSPVIPMAWEKNPFLTQIFIIWQLMETAGSAKSILNGKIRKSVIHKRWGVMTEKEEKAKSL